MAIDELPTPIGEAPAFHDMLDQISRLAPLDRPALVIGERGTGKELVAARLHFLSPRWEGPLVKVNCAALSESLLDAELFGHEAGAFTGATRRRPGRFELADDGTLFLDEIAQASAAIQEKLLRVIEYGSFERVGGTETLHVDVRIVAATNVDLPAAATAGRFRADLLDRLAFDVVNVPPLRARPGDVALLAQHFAATMAAELDRDRFPGFAPAALKALEAHVWPGNVRELKNVVERAVYQSAADAPVDAITLDPFASPWRKALGADAPAPATEAPQEPSTTDDVATDLGTRPLDLAATVDAFERGIVERALEACRHNGRAAAEHLGLSYDQLRHRLRKHGL